MHREAQSAWRLGKCEGKVIEHTFGVSIARFQSDSKSRCNDSTYLRRFPLSECVPRTRHQLEGRHGPINVCPVNRYLRIEAGRKSTKVNAELTNIAIPMASMPWLSIKVKMTTN
jgi:hypothetical protein